MSDGFTFIPNPALAAELRASAQMNVAVAEIAAKIAADAEAIGEKYGYVGTVKVEAGEATVEGSTTGGQGITNLAGWLEFGQGPFPNLQPLRSAADRNGMAVRSL